MLPELQRLDGGRTMNKSEILGKKIDFLVEQVYKLRVEQILNQPIIPEWGLLLLVLIIGFTMGVLTKL